MPATPTSRVSTRQKEFHIDESLRKYTREERKEITERKRQGEAEKKQGEKIKKEREVEKRRQKIAGASRRLAHFEDQQVSVLAGRYSLRPDLDLASVHSPPLLAEKEKSKPATTSRQTTKRQPPSMKEGGITLSDDDDIDPTVEKKKAPVKSKISQHAQVRHANEGPGLIQSEIPIDPRLLNLQEVTEEFSTKDSSELVDNVVLPMEVDVPQRDMSDGSEYKASDPGEKPSGPPITAADFEAFKQWMVEKQKQEKEEEKLQKRKEASEKRKVEKAHERSVVRDAILESRSTKSAPTQNVVSSSNANSRKRGLSTVNDKPDLKKSRPDAKGVEGIRSDFLKTLAQKPPKAVPPTSQTQAPSSENSDQEKSDLDSNSTGSELVGGVFDEDQSTDAVTDARKNKDLLKTDPKRMKAKQGLPENPVLKCLVSADINGIDEKESQVTPQKPSRKTVTFKDLPFPSDYAQVYQKKWEQHFMAHILHFAETQELQFGIGNRPELSSFVTGTWKQVFPELKEHSKDANILKFVQVELRNYRSNVGKEALAIVGRKISAVNGSFVERAEWISEQLKNDQFVYSEPKETRKESKGTLRGPGIIETFAYHMKSTASVERQNSNNFRFPAGALALSAAAYERALKIYTPGYNAVLKARKDEQDKRKKEGRSTKLPKNDKDSFSDENWAEPVRSYYRVVKDAGWGKWTVFHTAVKEYLPQAPDVEENDSEDSDDRSAVLVLSSEI